MRYVKLQDAGKIYFDNTNQMLAMHLYGDDRANPTKVIEDFKAVGSTQFIIMGVMLDL